MREACAGRGPQLTGGGSEGGGCAGVIRGRPNRLRELQLPTNWSASFKRYAFSDCWLIGIVVGVNKDKI